jgi:hypothetical protein
MFCNKGTALAGPQRIDDKGWALAPASLRFQTSVIPQPVKPEFMGVIYGTTEVGSEAYHLN